MEGVKKSILYSYTFYVGDTDVVDFIGSVSSSGEINFEKDIINISYYELYNEQINEKYEEFEEYVLSEVSNNGNG